LIYSLAIGLIWLCGICVTGAEPAGQPVSPVMQTACGNVPYNIPAVGSVGLKVV
jgi:hypothetical protein